MECDSFSPCYQVEVLSKPKKSHRFNPILDSFVFISVLLYSKCKAEKRLKELIEVSQSSHLSLMAVSSHSVGSYWASGALRLILIGSCTVGRYLQLLACGYGMIESEIERGEKTETVKTVMMRRERGDVAKWCRAREGKDCFR